MSSVRRASPSEAAQAPATPSFPSDLVGTAVAGLANKGLVRQPAAARQ
jgi:hypothetical protein